MVQGMNIMIDTDSPLFVGTISDDLQIDYQAWRDKPKPHGISACIRVRNESQFMHAAVRSIVNFVDEVILCVQPSTDKTREIAIALEQEYPKVRSYYYPLVPDWIDTKGFYEKDPDQPGHLVHMSNWALSKCSYSWILKVEGDVIALPTLKGMIDHALTKNQLMYYGLVILNVAGHKMDQISWENPRNGGWDEAIFPNHPDLVRFRRRHKWEVAVPEGVASECLGWALLHMKRCKRGKENGWNGEHYIEWDQFNVTEALSNYNKQSPYPGPDDPFGNHVLYTTEWMKYL
jgi:hypothetical protein